MTTGQTGLCRLLMRMYVLAIACAAGIASGDDSLHVVIDRLVALQTPDYEKIAAPICSDEEFIRRIWLDLAGAIPPVAEVRKFLADLEPNKREKQIDQLLASPEYARHMQRTFDLILMRGLPQKHVPVAEWEKFLREAFADNRPWDRIVRDILNSDGSDPANRGPARFYLDREGEVNEITRDIGKVFLGADLQCAQCHNHPQIGDYKQPYYYGISAFFVRSFVMTDAEKRVVFAEKAEGEATYESVFEMRDKISAVSEDNGPSIVRGTADIGAEIRKTRRRIRRETKRQRKNRAADTPFQPRAEFAEFIASTENRRFCRTTANRLWALMMGRGIVHPVELDHSDNPPSHPLLLALLAEELAKAKLDVKFFIREIALSQTYQRSSRRAGDAQAALHPGDSLFAAALLKPLSPAQFAWSAMQAAGEIDANRPAISPDALELEADLKAQVKAGQVEPEKQPLVNKAIEAEMHKKLVGYEQRFTQLFGGAPGLPPETFETTTDQVLFLANDPAIAGFLIPKTGNLAERLLKLPEDSPHSIAEELFFSTLNRRPTEDDVRDVTEYLVGQSGPLRVAALKELIWATISSSEFRFNH